MAKSWMVVHMKVDANGEIAGSNRPRTLYRTEREAIAIAEDIASRFPTEQVFLFEAKSVIETKKPQVIRKSFNSEGELLPTSDLV